MIPALGLSSCEIPCSSTPLEAEAPIGVEALASVGKLVDPAVTAGAAAEVTSKCAPSRVPPLSIKAVLAADSLAKVMSAEFPVFWREEMAPQKRKKSLTLSSEVSGESPATCEERRGEAG